MREKAAAFIICWRWWWRNEDGNIKYGVC